MPTPEPSMTYLGRKGWRSKAGRFVFLTNIIFHAFEWLCCFLTPHALFVLTLCRWWRGRGRGQKFERSMKGYREKGTREDSSNEQTPRFIQLLVSLFSHLPYIFCVFPHQLSLLCFKLNVYHTFVWFSRLFFAYL